MPTPLPHSPEPEPVSNGLFSLIAGIVIGFVACLAWMYLLR